MVFSDVPFAAIRKLLLDLGFIEKTMPKANAADVPGIVFGHAESRPSSCSPTIARRIG